MKTQAIRTINALLSGVLLTLLLVTNTWAQTPPTSTEQRLQALREQIAADERLLSDTEQAEQVSLQTLKGIDRELAIRRELTVNYQARLTELTLASDSLRMSLDELEKDLAVLQKQYQRRATHAYKYGRMHDLALILSSTSINQMLIRARYLNRFTDQRKRKLEAIQKASISLEERRMKLVEARVQTQLLLREAQKEQTKMNHLQRNRQGVIQNLRTQKTTIADELSQKRVAVTEFEKHIRNVITTADTQRRAEANPQDEVDYAGYTGAFRSSKGILPWPASGVVVEPFGDLVNPVHGTTTPNPGILIATTPHTEVRAVADGTVISVSVIPEFGRYIAVQHGEYQSVYSNFSMLYVNEGMQVKAGHVIGRAGTEAEPKEAGIFFGLFKNGEPFDPMRWLQPQ